MRYLRASYFMIIRLRRDLKFDGLLFFTFYQSIQTKFSCVKTWIRAFLSMHSNNPRQE